MKSSIVDYIDKELKFINWKLWEGMWHHLLSLSHFLDVPPLHF